MEIYILMFLQDKTREKTRIFSFALMFSWSTSVILHSILEILLLTLIMSVFSEKF